jgi:hypothetical protein
MWAASRPNTNRPVLRQEPTWLATALICATARRPGVAGDRLTLHAAKGAALASQPAAAQFQTLKHRPDFPDRFPSLAGAYARHPEHSGASPESSGAPRADVD